jgi:hypothetical protein
MDVFVTFYDRGKDEGLIVSNGFSFVRHHYPDAVDVFLLDGEGPESVARKLAVEGATRFFCSVAWDSHLKTVEPFADERWVIGGPYAHFIRHSGIAKKYEVVVDSFESWAGLPIGETFTSYFVPLVRQERPQEVYYNLAVGSGCYWKGCNFCTYSHIREEEYRRPHIRNILETFPMVGGMFNRANLGYAAVPPDVLEEVLLAKKRPDLQLKFFLRGDDEILRVLERFKGIEARGLLPGIGLESPSQTIVTRLNKGVFLTPLLQVVDKILSLGGGVRLNLMDHYPFATKACVSEARLFLSALSAVHKKHGKRRIVIDNAGSTWWYSKGPLLGCSCQVKEIPVSEFRVAYKAVIPKGSEAWEANRAISQMLLECGIPIVGCGGKDFISLKEGAE